MISDTLGAWLFTQTWQVTLLVMVVAAVTVRFGRTRPHLAHALWLVVLVKCFTPPIWASPSGLFCWISPNATHSIATDGARVITTVETFDDRQPTWTNLPADGRFEYSAEPVELPLAESREANSGIVERGLFASSWRIVQRIAVPVWLGGAAIALALGIGRTWRFLRRIQHAESREVPALTATVDRLRHRLGVRRNVCVRVTDAGIGPVIVGLRRPTIYLPAALVESWPDEALEPILAHELVHQRRGDLWFCWLQWLARCVWWFHPAVAWACRSWNREVERCCDEETVASMSYAPGLYARSLLAVLQRKLEWRSASVFPGVRPLDITTYRLERIMRLGQGSRRRTPLWCWACMLLVAWAVLPGAAFVAEGKDRHRGRLHRRPVGPASTVIRQTLVPPLSPAPVAEGLKPNDEDLRKASMITLDIISCDGQAWKNAMKDLQADSLTHVLPHDAAQGIVEKLLKEPGTQRLSRPRIVAIEGRPAQVGVVAERPFVIGLEDVPVNNGKQRNLTPLIKTVEEGVRVELTTHQPAADVMEVEMKARIARVVEIEKVRDDAGNELQKPRVSESSLNATVRLGRNQRMLGASPEQKRADGSLERTIYLLSCEPLVYAPPAAQSLRVYSVADLVIALPGLAKLDLAQAQGKGGPGDSNTKSVNANPLPAKPQVNFAPLISLIKSTISPDEWKPKGAGDIQSVDDNFSLCVNADAATHEKIAELLSQLRRLQDIQIVFETRVIGPDEALLRIAQEERWSWREPQRVDAGPPMAVLDAAAAMRLETQLAQSKSRRIAAPKVTVFNGQVASISMSMPADGREAQKADEADTEPNIQLQFSAVASSDRSKLRFSLASGAPNRAEEWMSVAAVREISGDMTLVADISDDLVGQAWREQGIGARSPAGQALLRQWIDPAKKRPLWVILKPRLLIVEEEPAKQLQSPKNGN